MSTIYNPYSTYQRNQGRYNYTTPENAFRATVARALAAGRFDGPMLDKDKLLNGLKKFKINKIEDVLEERNKKALRHLTTYIVLADFFVFCLLLDIDVDADEKFKEIIDEAYNDVETLNVAVFIPRGHLKTTLLLAYGVWIYLRDRMYFDISPRIGILHADFSKAQDNLTLIKHYFHKDQVRSLFPKITQIRVENSRTLDFIDSQNSIARKEPNYMILSPNSPNVGIHVSVLLIDDLSNLENNVAEEKRREVEKKYASLFPLFDQSRRDGLHIRLVGTRYSDDDIYEHKILTPNSIFKQIVVPIVNEKGEPNFPNWSPLPKIEMLKKQLEDDPDYYNSQYMMIPYSAAGAGLPKALVSDYKVPEVITYRTLVCDPAISAARRASEAVIHVVSFLPDGGLSVDFTFAGQGVTPTELIDTLVKLTVKYKVDSVIIESIAYQQALHHYLRKRFIEERIAIPVIKHAHSVGKAEHARLTLAPYLEGNKINCSPVSFKLKKSIEQGTINDHTDALSFISSLELATIHNLPPKTLEGNYINKPKRVKSKVHNPLGF